MPDIKTIKQFISNVYPFFGINKKNEIIRLAYEISKREEKPFKEIFSDIPEQTKKFSDVKDYLMSRRFPSVPKNEKDPKIKLTELCLNPRYVVRTRKSIPKGFKNIFVERDVLGTKLVKRLNEKFPKANFRVIASYKDHISKKPYDLAKYNDRRNDIFIIKEKFDFFQDCPCTKEAKGCGYHNMKLGWGCPFECIYCFLPAYVNSPGIVIPANIEDFFKKFKKYKQNVRLGTGQFTDSLCYDDITGFSSLIIEFFRNYPKTTFEFKTKSDNIDLLLKQKPANNIVVAWSLNPEKIIKKTEFYTASLRRRLAAAKKCADKGFRVAFHFDPIFYYPKWENDYRGIVDRIFDSISAKKIAWISLGTLRMSLKQKKVIENRFPSNKILDAELIPGFDTKLRYPLSVRKNIYYTMRNSISLRSKTVPVYLCMEK